MRDTDSGEVWSNLYHPLDRRPDRYTVHFPLDRAEYRRRDNGIETQTELIVSPEDDVEIRRITLINRSIRTEGSRLPAIMNWPCHHPSRIASIQPLTSCSSRQNSRGPAKLCWLTEELRQEDDPPIYTVHSLDLVEESKFPECPNLKQIVGCSLAGAIPENPMGIETNWAIMKDYVLDPIFCIRREFHLPPGQSVQLIAILGVAESREVPCNCWKSTRILLSLNVHLKLLGLQLSLNCAAADSPG